MIHGIGTDLVEVRRIQRVWESYGTHFSKRILMPEELAGFDKSKNPVRYLAMRFAAKEAIVKALGTGFHYGMWVRDAGSITDKRGRPLVIFSDRGRAVCRTLGAGEAYVSLSDEAGMVLAMAVILKEVISGY
ncbi:MAG TPA: holo-ACP synthase [Gammaproteobacteria bacterium]|nr:holo-ACP synthase [Gammaproteobacteria bacterium]